MKLGSRKLLKVGEIIPSFQGSRSGYHFLCYCYPEWRGRYFSLSYAQYCKLRRQKVPNSRLVFSSKDPSFSNVDVLVNHRAVTSSFRVSINLGVM